MRIRIMKSNTLHFIMIEIQYKWLISNEENTACKIYGLNPLKI